MGCGEAGKVHASMISADEFQALIEADMELSRMLGIGTELIEPGRAVLRMRWSPDLTRPGGTVSGPALMALADTALYAVLLGRIGKVALAVTTSFNINFLRKPGPADILAEAKILKLGKRLAVMECHLYSEGQAEPVAHATGTYSIPQADLAKSGQTP
jgi:uncharacterized protein (TIGR00369 family)